MLDLSKQVISVGKGPTRPSPIEPLSEQEERVLKLFAAAKNSAQIAKELNITLPTLRNHLHAINQKLRTHNRLEAVLHAINAWSDLTPPPTPLNASERTEGRGNSHDGYPERRDEEPIVDSAPLAHIEDVWFHKEVSGERELQG